MGFDQEDCHGRPARGQTGLLLLSGLYYGRPLCGMLLALRYSRCVPRAASSSGEIPMAVPRHIADSLIIRAWLFQRY